MRARARTLSVATCAGLLALVAACNVVLGIDVPAESEESMDAAALQIDATAPADAPDAMLPSSFDAPSEPDATSPESSDAGAGDSANAAPADASIDADPYHDAANPAFWASFTLSVDAATFPGFAGGTFDGRYVYAGSMYKTPAGGAARYDTRGDASFDGGWQTLPFQTTSDGVSIMPWGAVYDGVSVNFVPGDTRTVPAAYPTSAPFEPGSITTVPASTWYNRGNWVYGGFCGGAVLPAQDGGAAPLVLAPYDSWNIDGSGPNDTVALLDSQGWHYHALPVPANHEPIGEFCGAVFDGQYVYFIPSVGYGAVAHLRFNTTLHPALTDSFADPNAWELVDVSTVGTKAAGFFGGVFDGRYVYYVPFVGTVVARFDTRAKSLADASAWETFDLTKLGTTLPPKGFQGGAFDGRFVYLVPTTTAPSTSFSSNPRAWPPDAGVPPLVRYDTQGQRFDQPEPWQTLDLRSVNAGVAGFTGGVFDGEYLYLVPAQGSTFLRFDARNANGLGPPGYSHGSFF